MPKSVIMPYVARLATSRKIRLWREWPARIKQRVTAKVPTVKFFHQFDNPYSYLALEITTELLHRYKINVEVVIVEDSQAPGERQENWIRYRLHDARRLARAWRMSDFIQVDSPDRNDIDRCLRCLAKIPVASRPAVALNLTRALWNATPDKLHSIWEHYGVATAEQALHLVRQGNDERQALGHYQSATWYFQGNWYWGLDRLEYFEEDLCRWHLQKGDTTIHGEMFTPRLIPKLDGSRLDVFFSFRSPYSYLALERLFDLARHRKLDLRLRPIMPMVERGVPLSRAKRDYILKDAARIAWRYQIAFGFIQDPLGPGIDNCMGLFFYAQQQQKEIPLVMNLMRGIWSEGADVSKAGVLARLCASAGVDWNKARSQLEQAEVPEQLEKNRQQLELLGLWGVPTFTLTDDDNRLLSVYWGQDRLPWLEYGLSRQR